MNNTHLKQSTIDGIKTLKKPSASNKFYLIVKSQSFAHLLSTSSDWLLGIHRGTRQNLCPPEAQGFCRSVSDTFRSLWSLPSSPSSS